MLILYFLRGFGSVFVASFSSVSHMASCLSLFLVGFLVLSCEAIAAQRNLDETEITAMDEDELLGLFDVMGSLLDEPGWSEVHPEPCSDTPWPGIECEIGSDDPPTFHVTAIHVGPDVATPPCQPSAKISDSLLKLPYLKTLSIFNCFVASPVTLSPALFGGLSSLEHLTFQSNPSLSGEIPPSLGKISNLRVLSLSQNNLQGKIPLELGKLANLEQLHLSYNNLSGEIPDEIGGLTSLAILDLSSNGFEGQLPLAFGNLQLLQKIDLCSNRIHGKIPPEMGNLNRLVLLDMSHNLINGPIPENLTGLEQLQYLIFDYNPINSMIPLFVGSLEMLKSMSFSGCGLIGTVPNSLSSLKNLTALSLDHNSLIGPIPPNLGSLPNLDQLNLSHNKLSGEIQLPEMFIKRLGKRLDVKGNGGLCTSYQLSRKNISEYLQTPVCLDTKGMVGNVSVPNQQRADDFEGRNKPSWNHGKISSLAPSHDPRLISTCCLLFYVLSFL